VNNRASCSRFVEIGRSASPEEVPALRQHLDECLYCQTQWAATKGLVEAIRQLPTKAPEMGRRQQMRNALVLAAGEPRRGRVSPRWAQAAVYVAVVFGAAGVLAAVGTIAIPWLQKQTQAAPAGDRVRGRPHAKAPFEPQAKTETITAPASEAVSVEARAPQLPILEKAARRPATTRKPQALALALPAAPPPSSTNPPSPAELAFSEGWQALRSDDYPRAAAAMRRASEAAPASALAADARYWEAVALARQGLQAKARLALEEFLRRFPGSPRAGEVSAMLGWLLLDSHEWSAAERLFHAAESDRAPAVRESAKKGLEITGQPRGRNQRGLR
jgi:TolA-binding protein